VFVLTIVDVLLTDNNSVQIEHNCSIYQANTP